MKQKKIKLTAKTLFVYRSMNRSSRLQDTTAQTATTITTTTTHAFNK